MTHHFPWSTIIGGAHNAGAVLDHTLGPGTLKRLRDIGMIPTWHADWSHTQELIAVHRFYHHPGADACTL